MKSRTIGYIFFLKRPIPAKFGLILYIPVILEEQIIMYM